MLFRLNDEIEVKWKRDKHWGNELRIRDTDIQLDDIIACFVEVFLYERLNPMIQKIAREKFLYTDHEEIERISLLTDWILMEKSFQQRLYHEHESLAAYIFHILRDNLKNLSPIHFDSLVTFCMQPISECLENAVGFGIDEMKREEEYQSFVHSVRNYIMNRET